MITWKTILSPGKASKVQEIVFNPEHFYTVTYCPSLTHKVKMYSHLQFIKICQFPLSQIALDFAAVVENFM